MVKKEKKKLVPAETVERLSGDYPQERGHNFLERDVAETEI